MSTSHVVIHFLLLILKLLAEVMIRQYSFLASPWVALIDTRRSLVIDYCGDSFKDAKAAFIKFYSNYQDRNRLPTQLVLRSLPTQLVVLGTEYPLPILELHLKSESLERALLLKD